MNKNILDRAIYGLKTLPTESEALINFIVENFNVFDPWNDSENKLPRKAGNYVFLLKKETPLPTGRVINTPIIRIIELNGKEYQLIYTGGTSGLQRRIGNNHFGNNARWSTLRHSLGCLMDFTKIYHDDNKMFKQLDEMKLTEWMQKNLIVLYYVNPNYDNDEKSIISALNPPLNIDENHCRENAEFRLELYNLRNTKRQIG